MIIQEIPLLPQPFTVNPINVTLNEQSCQITLDSINEFSEYSLQIINFFTVFNLNFNGQQIVRGAFCRSRSNLTPFCMPRNTIPNFSGNIFFYSPYTTDNPLYVDFGTIYRLFYSDEFAFDPNDPLHDEFINALKGYFKR